ncbi:hypothetical protein LguiA_007791 [Lonicera macranthoides]
MEWSFQRAIGSPKTPILRFDNDEEGSAKETEIDEKTRYLEEIKRGSVHGENSDEEDWWNSGEDQCMKETDDDLLDKSGLGLTVAGDEIGEDTDKEDYETNSESFAEEDSVVALRGLFEESDSLDELHRELNPKRQPCTDFTGPCYSKITPVGSSFNFGPGTQTDSPSFPLTFDCFHNSPNNCLVEMGKDRTNNFEKVDISKPWGNYQNVLIKQCNCRLKSNEKPHFHCTENAINKIFEGAQESGKAVGRDKADNVSTLLNEMNLKLVPIKKGKGNRARKAYGGPEGQYTYELKREIYKIATDRAATE